VTPAERGDLAERLLPVAATLACIVHGDGDQRDIAHTLRRVQPDQQDALIVVLAGLINPDVPLADALGYITWDETGRPAKSRPDLAGTIRDLALNQHVASGVIQLLEAEQKHAARMLHHDRHFTYSEIGEQLGICEQTVGRWLKSRRAA
jgi:hypothetical protein